MPPYCGHARRISNGNEEARERANIQVGGRQGLEAAGQPEVHAGAEVSRWIGAHPGAEQGKEEVVCARAARGLRSWRLSMKKLVILLLALASVAAFAHSGGTDKNGCHNDRKNGGYHCH